MRGMVDTSCIEVVASCMEEGPRRIASSLVAGRIELAGGVSPRGQALLWGCLC